ncbi:transposase [Psychromonas sp.]|uniref:transposase n=1 Tax=Psychromonas sp. TaxID=1884585 RepID=UPI0039E6EB98
MVKYSSTILGGHVTLTYPARYLYRFVISEQNILSLDNGQVTFQYKESKSKQFKAITEP